MTRGPQSGQEKLRGPDESSGIGPKVPKDEPKFRLHSEQSRAIMPQILVLHPHNQQKCQYHEKSH